MTQQLELNIGLPKPLPKLANRDVVRANTKIGTQVYNIDFKNIRERPGFNGRLSYDGIEELADSLVATGLNNPLTIDMTEDGKAWVEMGYRRFRAIKLLDERKVLRKLDMPNLSYGLVGCLRNTTDTTDMERVLRIISSNNQVPLKPLEIAYQVKRLNEAFALSHKQIAEKIGYSRQQVENLLILANEPQEIRDAVLEGNIITPTAVYALFRAFPNQEERLHHFQNATFNREPITLNYVKELKELKKTAAHFLGQDTVKQSDELKAGLGKLKASIDESREAAITDTDTDDDTDTDEELDDYQKEIMKNSKVSVKDLLKPVPVPEPVGHVKGEMPMTIKEVPYNPASEDRSHITGTKPAKPGVVNKEVQEGNDETYMCTEVSGYFDKIEILVSKLDNKQLVGDIERWCAFGRQRMEIIKIFTQNAEVR